MEGGGEVGFALFFHNFSTFLGRAGIYLEDLYVRPEFRGRGYGKALLKKLAAIAVGTRLRQAGMVVPRLEQAQYRLLPVPRGRADDRLDSLPHFRGHLEGARGVARRIRPGAKIRPAAVCGRCAGRCYFYFASICGDAAVGARLRGAAESAVLVAQYYLPAAELVRVAHGDLMPPALLSSSAMAPSKPGSSSMLFPPFHCQRGASSASCGLQP